MVTLLPRARIFKLYNRLIVDGEGLFLLIGNELGGILSQALAGTNMHAGTRIGHARPGTHAGTQIGHTHTLKRALKDTHKL